MLTTPALRRSLPASVGPGWVRRWAACAIVVVGASLAAGCAAPGQDGPAIRLSSAQVTEPSADGVTDVYVDVQNNGPADQIVGARLSVGGTVTLRSPRGAGVA